MGGQFGLPHKSPASVAMFFSSSCTFIIPREGWYRLSAVGAGGSGGANGTEDDGGVATGGGGGGFCEIEVYLSTNDELTIVIGAGGVGVTPAIKSDGSDGGDTTIHGSGSDNAVALNIHAGGGKAGSYMCLDHTAVAGGAGGTASGGEINASGGAGGSAYHHNTSCAASGGGASGSPYGTGGAGGNCTLVSPATNVSAGGGAIGGFKGGGATATGYHCGGAGTGRTVDVNTFSGGKGRLFRGPNITLSSADGITRMMPTLGAAPVSGDSPGIGFESLSDPFRAMSGKGSDGAVNTGATGAMSGPGGGGGGISAAATYGAYALVNVCGGGGGSCFTGGAASVKCSIGGGSGGACSMSNGAASSGTGGDGLVTIQNIG